MHGTISFSAVLTFPTSFSSAPCPPTTYDVLPAPKRGISLPNNLLCRYVNVQRNLKTQAMQALRGKVMDGGEAKEDAALSTWAHARAALVLRTEAVSVALRWVAGAKAIQVGVHTWKDRGRKRCSSTYTRFEESRQLSIVGTALPAATVITTAINATLM